MDKELKKLSRIEILELMLSQKEEQDILAIAYDELQTSFNNVKEELENQKKNNAELSEMLNNISTDNEEIRKLKKDFATKEAEYKNIIDRLTAEKDTLNSKVVFITKEFNSLKDELVNENKNLHATLNSYEKKLNELNNYKNKLKEEYTKKQQELRKDLETIYLNKTENEKMILEAKQLQEEADKKMLEAKSMTGIMEVVLSVLNNEDAISNILEELKDNGR